METRRFELFARIVEAGSISRAASELGVAQPALSQQLAILERELGAELLRRSVSGVTMTPAGRALYSRSQTIVRLIGELRSMVKSEAGEVAGTVPIGIPPSLAQRLGEPLFSRLRAEVPMVLLQVMEAGGAALSRALVDGAVDIAIVSGPPRDRHLRSETLFAEPLFLVCSKAFPDPNRLSLSELALLPWIVTRPTNSIRKIVDAVLNREGVVANVVAEIDSITVVTAAVVKGMGVTVLPEGAIPADPALYAVPFSDARRTLSLCWREPLAPASEYVLERMRALAHEVVA